MGSILGHREQVAMAANYGGRRPTLPKRQKRFRIFEEEAGVASRCTQDKRVAQNTRLNKTVPGACIERVLGLTPR